MAPSANDPERREPRIRSGPTLGKKNVSVPISIGLPILVVGAFLIATGASADNTLFWILGAAALAVGLLLFTSGRTL